MLTQARAKEIWSKRGIQNEVSHAMTEDEQNEILREWKLMDGRFSWMDAFFRFLNGYAERQRSIP